MCQDLFKYLLETGGADGPEQKTIIFCARDRHADDVAVCLNNLYAKWCHDNGKQKKEFFAFKCTAAGSGNDQLPDLRGSSRSHFIATTVDLLSTGVDVPCVRNIVFFKYIKSPISFYQMVGRGTRIDLPTGKLMFRVYDYTDATRLFGEDFLTKPKTPDGESGEPPPPPPPEPTISVEGFDVHVTDAGRFIVAQVDGKAMPIPLEEYKARLAAELVAKVKTLADFRGRWVDPPSRQELLDMLVSAGYSPRWCAWWMKRRPTTCMTFWPNWAGAWRHGPARTGPWPSYTSRKTGSRLGPPPQPPPYGPSPASSNGAAPKAWKTRRSSRPPK